jgi:SAM-dependent methyltransferase
MDDAHLISYLNAKKSVDDRAINAGIYEQLHRHLQQYPRPVRVLELGAGTGAMIDRLLERGTLDHASYTAVDRLQALADYAAEQTTRWRTLAPRVTVRWEIAEAEDFIALALGQQHWDLIIAHAFLDLVDLASLLPRLLSLLAPGGFFYFTANFDGLTVLEPVVDPEMDALIVRLYHEDMDRRLRDGRPAGDSRTGRHLFDLLRVAEAEIVAAGSSDWVVYATPQGHPPRLTYHGDEATFLRAIIDTIGAALDGHAQLNAEEFSAWIAARHAQIDAGELVYIAHQLDFLGRYPASVRATGLREVYD